MQDKDNSRLELVPAAVPYLEAGSPEVQVFDALGEEGLPLAELKVTIFMVAACSVTHNAHDSIALSVDGNAELDPCTTGLLQHGSPVQTLNI